MKHFKTVFLFLFVCTIATHTSCAQWGSKKIEGNKTVIEENRTLSAYSEIAVSGNFEVELVKGTPGKITIVAESNLLEHIITVVKKGSLSIEVAKKINLNPNEKIRIIIPFTELEEVSLSGSGSIRSEAVIEAKKFSLASSGSATIHLQVNISKSFDVSKSGSGDMHLQGKAKNLDLKSSGSGKFKSENLVVDEADISLSGSGKIYLTCNEKIKAKVSGSGNIYYNGNPSTRDIKVSGSGKVERL